MIVDHPRGLHVRIADGRSKKGESAFFHVLADFI